MKIAVAGVLGLAMLTWTGIAAQEKKAAPFEVEVVKDIAYYQGEGDDKVRHKLDLYLPRGAKDYPVFFYIHGGGWRRGSKDGASAHGKTFAKNGIGFVAVNYRLSPAEKGKKDGIKHPAHIEDVARAFAWCVANLGKRGANVEQIYIGGHSAGGHLAALLATDESYLGAHKLSPKNIKGVVPISGVFRVGRMNDVFGDAESSKKASPLTHVKEGLPPFLIFYADKESGGLGKQAEAFGKALEKVKGQVKVKMISNRTHGTIMSKAAKEDDEVTKAIFAFIRDKGALKTDK
jgi:acetyl esterase/lipase